MKRRHLALGLAISCCGQRVVAQLGPSFTWDYFDPVHILLQDVADLAYLPLTTFATGLPLLPIGNIPNIPWYALQDLPGLMTMTVGQIPGLQEELAGWGYTYSTGCLDPFGVGCSGDITPDTILSTIPDLNWDYFIHFPSIQALPLGEITITDPLRGITTSLFSSEAGIALSSLPGLGQIPFYTSFDSIPLFSGVFPAMVEIIAHRLQAGDAAIFAVDRGHPWRVGTYRYIFSNLRVQLDSISTEVPGTANFHLEVLVCVPFIGCYWIGPFPWPSATEQNYALYIPEGLVGFIPQYPLVPYNPDRNAPANPSTTVLYPGDCSSCHGIAIQAYAMAISGIEGGYASVGPWQARYRSYPLGRYQYLSGRSDVRAVILQNPTGPAFLNKVDQGIKPSPQEVLQNFTPQQQDSFFRQEACQNITLASQQIDPTTGQPFSGNRLIERAAQIHFAGPSPSRIDSSRSDSLGRLSIYGYGKTALANYQRALAQLPCSRA